MDILRNDYVAKIAAKSWNGMRFIINVLQIGNNLLPNLMKQIVNNLVTN